MPNPFHFRANIDRLWRRADDRRHRGYLRVKALDAIVRELFARNNPRAQTNYAMYLATDPYDVARHKLRHLYDRPSLSPLLPPGEASLYPPLPLGEGWGEGSPALEDEPPEEDDDPL